MPGAPFWRRTRAQCPLRECLWNPVTPQPLEGGAGEGATSWAKGLGRVPGGEAVCRAWVWESAAAFGGVEMGRQEARTSGLC